MVVVERLAADVRQEGAAERRGDAFAEVDE
jgi:hypothetical protein